MKYRRIATLVGLTAVLGMTSSMRAQQPSQEEQLKKVTAEKDYTIWRQKAQLELEILQAQVKAKQAEIQRAEAKHLIRRLAPTQAVLAKLEKPAPFHFPEKTPLEDVLRYFKGKTQGPNDPGIPIYVDPAGLQEAEKTMQSPVQIDVEGLPLKTALRLVLKQLGLDYSVQGGLLTITAEGSVDRPIEDDPGR